jgi:uncharacterized protein (TIGR02757 family)
MERNSDIVCYPGTVQTHPALGRYLERLAARYGAAHLGSDPISLVRRFPDPEDREVAGFLAAGLAFGRVGTILSRLRDLWARLDGAPAAAVDRWSARDAARLAGFRHRWVDGEDVAVVLRGLGAARRRHGSLKGLFLRYHDPAARDLSGMLSGGIQEIAGLAARGRPLSRGARALLTDPRGGAACKRLNLFTRWMVRADDGVDLGLYAPIRPDQLVMPLDTHVARISRYLGLTERRTVDWKMAVDVTDSLRRFAPQDPVRYDFALSRLGILSECPRRVDPRRCRGCLLLPACVLGRSFRPRGRARAS